MIHNLLKTIITPPYPHPNSQARLRDLWRAILISTVVVANRGHGGHVVGQEEGRKAVSRIGAGAEVVRHVESRRG